MLNVFMTMWEQPTKHIECKKLLIEEGAKVQIDGEESQMLAVITTDAIFHPVVSVEVL